VSDTPRTDEAQFGTGRVSVGFARQLELELNAANDRIKRLEEAGDAMSWTLNSENWLLVGWRKAKETKP
jgi:hypothetical protein